MVDFHTHILPNVDDGSKSVRESLEMLRLLSSQGVTTVCATPHFYARRTSPEAFVIKRQKAFDSLKPYLTPDHPSIILGAEVLYYEGICQTEDLSLLRLSGTKMLLLEMPTVPWTERMISTIIELNSRPDVTIVLAHIERYLSANSKAVWDRLHRNGVMFQANAEFFNSFWTKRKAVKMLSKDRIHLIGTDCHNLTDRRPDIDTSLSYITKKLSSDSLYSMYKIEEYLKSVPSSNEIDHLLDLRMH